MTVASRSNHVQPEARSAVQAVRPFSRRCRPARNSGARARARGGFTLVELLTVIGIIALISTMTIMGFKAISKDAKRSSAKNAILASLDTARAYAIRNNQVVLVAFIPRLINEAETQVEIVTAEWTRGSTTHTIVGSGTPIFDRFRPISNVPSRRLPIGMNVAGPYLATDDDDLWDASSNLSKPTEAAGRIIGVMYAPNGTRILNNSVNDSDYFWIDFNGDKLQTPDPEGQPADAVYDMVDSADEACIQTVPFFCVFDERQCRELYGDGDWNSATTRINELSEYINLNADRIHFNRYTGVAMK